MDAPLDPEAIDGLRARGGQIRAALRDALGALRARPRGSRGGTGSRRPRVVRTAGCDDDLVALTRLPAARHLHHLADALDDDALAHTLREAVAAYARTLAEIGVGPVALKRLIRGDAEAGGG
jgi:hypothetical protein